MNWQQVAANAAVFRNGMSPGVGKSVWKTNHVTQKMFGCHHNYFLLCDIMHQNELRYYYHFKTNFTPLIVWWQNGNIMQVHSKNKVLILFLTAYLKNNKCLFLAASF